MDIAQVLSQTLTRSTVNIDIWYDTPSYVNNIDDSLQ
jgi:hypothetical protein